MIKLIATDMDGTLVKSDGNISDEFPEIFKKLREKGIKFVVASGRQYYKLRENFNEYSDDMAFIADNGTMVMYKEEELYSKELNYRQVKEIIKKIEHMENTHLVLSGKKKAYLDTNKKEIIDEIEKYYKEYEIVDDLETIDDEILKIAVYHPKNIEDLYNEYFSPHFGDKAKVSVSGEFWLDVYSKDTDKGIALKMIQEKFNIKKEETMAFGDYFNDTPMLKEAKYSYAMENAPEEFKKDANFIAKSNDENGVIEAIKEKINLSKSS